MCITLVSSATTWIEENSTKVLYLEKFLRFFAAWPEIGESKSHKIFFLHKTAKVNPLKILEL